MRRAGPRSSRLAVPAPPRVIVRLAIGTAVAVAIALAARRAHALDPSGAALAVVLGAAAAAAGWRWAIVLVAYFVASSALSQWRRAAKAARTRGIVAKGGARDAAQVFANGGVFGCCAVGAALLPHPLWEALALGALGAAAADTWGTEIGVAIGGTPRSILSGLAVPAGTSGGVTLAGLAATVAGAWFVGGVARVAGAAPVPVRAAMVGAVAGALVDSVLGATVQARYRGRDGALTERPTEDDGTPTARVRGWERMDNDAVNLCCTAAGAAVAWAAWGRV